MKRDLILMAVISLISLVVGGLLYRVTLYQPSYVSATPGAASTPVQSDSLSFDQIALDDLQQQSRYLNEWEAPVLILNFWATWCAPCRHEIPDLIELQQAYQHTVQLLGISFDSAENVRKFSQEYNFNYPLLIVNDKMRQLNAFFGNNSSGLPFTVILNAQREIIYQHAGQISGEELEKQIKPLI